MGLLLRAVDVAGPLTWRRLLIDEETGASLADHRVDLNPASDEVIRFQDLYGDAHFHAALDQPTQDGARLVTAAGEWAGRELLGESVASAIVAQAPVTVRVTAPEALDSVLLWPAGTGSCGRQAAGGAGDVTLVYDIAPQCSGGRKNEVGAELRILAGSPSPTGTDVLALRRERYALSQLIRRIAGRERAMVRLQVVQYGVTRERLEEIADSQAGWDIVHLAGHGAGGVFVLERADGSRVIRARSRPGEMTAPGAPAGEAGGGSRVHVRGGHLSGDLAVDRAYRAGRSRGSGVWRTRGRAGAWVRPGAGQRTGLRGRGDAVPGDRRLRDPVR